MLLLIVFLACIFIALGAGFMASLSDLRGLTIPNSYSVIVIASFIAAYAVLWMGGHQGIFFSLPSHLVAGMVIFGFTVFLFAIGAFGGADSKLASAYAFWMGWGGLLPFLFYTTLLGGVLGIVALGLRKWSPVKSPKPGSWIARVQAGEDKVPYGIAIAGGALVSFVKLGYFDTETLQSFLS